MFPKLLTITAFVLCLCGDVFPAPPVLDATNPTQRCPFLAKLILHHGAEIWSCAASLITEKWVVTAAHCVHDNNLSGVDVCFGESQQAADVCNGETFKSKSVHMHPGYKMPGGVDNDIALIELDRAVPESVAKRVLIAIPEMHIDYSGLKCNAFSWRNVNPTDSQGIDGLSDDSIESTAFALMSPNDGLRYEEITHQLSRNFLYSFNDQQPGNDGGPVVAKLDGVQILVGLSSHNSVGNVPKGKAPYSAYTKVQNYISWIHEVIDW